MVIVAKNSVEKQFPVEEDDELRYLQLGVEPLLRAPELIIDEDYAEQIQDFQRMLQVEPPAQSRPPSQVFLPAVEKKSPVTIQELNQMAEEPFEPVRVATLQPPVEEEPQEKQREMKRNNSSFEHILHEMRQKSQEYPAPLPSLSIEQSEKPVQIQSVSSHINIQVTNSSESDPAKNLVSPIARSPDADMQLYVTKEPDARVIPTQARPSKVPAFDYFDFPSPVRLVSARPAEKSKTAQRQASFVQDFSVAVKPIEKNVSMEPARSKPALKNLSSNQQLLETQFEAIQKKTVPKQLRNFIDQLDDQQTKSVNLLQQTKLRTQTPTHKAPSAGKGLSSGYGQKLTEAQKAKLLAKTQNAPKTPTLKIDLTKVGGKPPRQVKINLNPPVKQISHQNTDDFRKRKSDSAEGPRDVQKLAFGPRSSNIM